MKTISKNEVLERAECVKRTQLFDPKSNQYISGFASLPVGQWLYDEDVEPVLDIEGFTENGKHSPRLTVNRYNAVVLNSQNMLMADIDFGDERLSPFARVEDVEAVIESLSHLDQLDKHIDLFDVYEFAKQSYRVYRTHSGCRVICTSICLPFDECGMEAIRFMRFLKSDPQYMALCKVQGSYRSRLTPKPWRGEGETTHVCDLVQAIGATVHPELKSQLELHDMMTLAEQTYSCLA